jgi:hypothetical protein
MKKVIVLGLFVASIFLISCSKDDDFTDPDNLSGTEWKSLNVDTSYEEYYIFKFTSKTIIEFWIKEKDEVLYIEWSGVYSLSGNTITIDYGDDIVSGVIDGNKMNFAYDGEVMVFTKQ